MSDRCKAMTMKAINSKNDDETRKPKVRIRLKRQTTAPELSSVALENGVVMIV